MPTSTNQGCFPKTAFQIELTGPACTCPGGQTTAVLRPVGGGAQVFQFAAAVCQACPLRVQCVRGTGGRTVYLHPQEGLLQEARALQASPAFRAYRTRRQVVEHRLARLVQLGIRQARYRGRVKTLFQLLMAAAVANLTLLAGSVTAVAGSVALAAVLLLTLATFAGRWTRPRPPFIPAFASRYRSPLFVRYSAPAFRPRF